MLLFLGLFGFVYPVLPSTRHGYYDLFVQLIGPREKRRASGQLECVPDRHLGLLHLRLLLPGVSAIGVLGVRNKTASSLAPYVESNTLRRQPFP